MRHFGLTLFGFFAVSCGSEERAPAGDVGSRDEDATTEGGDASTVLDTGDAAEDVAHPDPTHPALIDTEPATFSVRPGVEIVTVLGATPSVPLTLYDRSGQRLISVIADAYGQAHFAYLSETHRVLDPTSPLPADFVQSGSTVPPGDGYVIRDDSVSPARASRPFRVLDVLEAPAPGTYEGQVLEGVTYGIVGTPEDVDPQDGMNYITVRDGVRLSAMVRFPDPALWGEGPYPTVIEYSGYAPSSPESPGSASRIATLLGYATVGVNMRGTGCSGGVFDVFSPAQHADGYDAVEVVARQSWVKGHKVGLIGLSYPGISQLYVAYTKPPSLAAITPMSVIADSWQQLRPGGIYNDGFTRQWLAQRDSEAAPNGQSWTDARIAWGDTLCAEHQRLRNQNMKFEELFRSLEFFPPSALARSLPHLVPQIDVPVYLSGGFQDEQTGPQFADMLWRFSPNAVRRFVLYNGRHPDGFSPPMLTRWWEFLELYVAGRVPRLPEWMRELGAAEFSREFDSTGLTFEPDRFATFSEDDFEAVKETYEAEPPVRVLFEMGGDVAQPGAPRQRFASEFEAWPPPRATTRTFFLGGQGSLLEEAPMEGGEDEWSHDAEAGHQTFFGGAGYQLMARLWDIDWSAFEPEARVAYMSAPLEEHLVLAGPAHVELWVDSDVDDVQVQASLSEVRPDGMEVLLTTGWLRLGHRVVDETSSRGNHIDYTYLREDYRPLAAREKVHTKVPIPSIGHVLRKGSRLRLVLSSPGRNQGTWEFEAPDYQDLTPRHRLSWGAEMPSALRLTTLEPSELTGGMVEGLPACPGLRGQACRPFEPELELRTD